MSWRCRNSDLFDGLVVATDWGLRFVDADQVELITVRHVRSRLDDAQAARLPPPDGQPRSTGSIRWTRSATSLDERLGQMFRRPHWTQETVAAGTGYPGAAGPRDELPLPP